MEAVHINYVPVGSFVSDEILPDYLSNITNLRANAG